MWRLYVCNLTRFGHKRYIWCQDNIIRHTRMICPIGWLEQEMNYFNVEFIGKHRLDESITDYFEFRPVRGKLAKMTQEQLSKGWLTL